MSQSKFYDALNALGKPQDSKTLLKILVTIRAEIEWPKNIENISKLRSKGCLKHFVNILHMPQKYILDVCLSILGNCIMDKGCTRDVIGTYNILSPLNQILKRHGKEDSINGRSFRIIGNMCQHRDQWGNLIIDRKPQIVSHILQIIKMYSQDDAPGQEKCRATLIMGIRALRMLLNGRTAIALIKTFGVLKVIGSLFIKLSLEWQESKANENVLNNIIRLLHDYSRYKYYHSIIEMRNTERGNSLSHLSNVLLLSPKRIVKIIMNFIKISQLRSELPVPEICDKFIDEMLKNLDTQEFSEECFDYIHCLCYLLEDPANRNIERCGKCLPLLIRILDNFKEPSDNELKCCILLVVTLNNCQYDESLIQEQLKCNIIEVLVRKLQWIVGNSEKLNLQHKNGENRKRPLLLKKYLELNTKKRKSVYSETSLNNPKSPNSILSPLSPTPSDENSRLLSVQSLSPCSSDDEFFSTIRYERSPSCDDHSLRKDRSPSPCSSIGSDMQLFQTISPCGSPLSVVNDGSDSDSDDYSPICSEADDEDFPLDETLETIDGEHGARECEGDTVVEEEENLDLIADIKNTNDNLKILLLTELTLLIKSFSRIHPPVPQLGSEELLLALLKCSEHFESTLSSNINTVDIILRILDSPEYLIPVMKTKFIEIVYDLTQAQHNEKCNKCNEYMFLGKIILKQFTSLAESGVGKGHIAHWLLRGSNEIREKLVLVIPYIVKDNYILAKLMLNCGGLDLLMKLLQSSSVLKERSIKILCAMAAKKLGIANPKDVTINLNKRKIITDKYKLSDSCTNVVTFKLDDGTTLKADREFLSEKSDFFGRLLNGHFKESTEDEIYLHNVKSKSLNCLLHLLKCVDQLETVEIKQDLDTLLDVIVLSDRYLMTNVCSSITNCVEKFNISSETVPTIYRWSLESGTNLLRIESIAFALVANIVDAERFVMFNNLFNLGYTEELLEDMQKLLVRYLSSFAPAQWCGFGNHQSRNF